MTKKIENPLMLSQNADIIASQSMYSSWVGSQAKETDNSPHGVLKAIMGVEVDLADIATGDCTKGTVMEGIMLKLAHEALHGNLTATQMIIKEVQHDGIDKHMYVDELPEDVKYLFEDVEFTEIEIDDQLEQAAIEHKQSLSDDKDKLDALIAEWG